MYLSRVEDNNKSTLKPLKSNLVLMKLQVAALVLLSIIGCKQKEEKENTQKSVNIESSVAMESEKTFFYVGTYTDGASEGIYRYSLGADGKLAKDKLVAKTESPSFLTFSEDKKYLLAVNELTEGTVSSFKISQDSLQFLNKKPSGGMHPCFVVSNEEGFVLTANYSSGNVGLLKLKEDGNLTDLLDTHQHKGKGAHDRQDGPHAHSVWLEPTQNDVIEVDLGTNELWFSEIDAASKKIKPKSIPNLAFEDGTGPRHMAFNPNGKWTYVYGELNNTITVLSIGEKGNYKVENTYSTLPEDFEGENTGADIHISSDGKFLYASNRGHNSIVIYKVNEDGSLNTIGYESVRGDGPRNFSLSPDGSYLLVANQYTDNIISFKRDTNTGLLTFVDEIEAPSPVCILF